MTSIADVYPNFGADQFTDCDKVWKHLYECPSCYSHLQTMLKTYRSPPSLLSAANPDNMIIALCVLAVLLLLVGIWKRR